MMNDQSSEYKQMWEDFASTKAKNYNAHKFSPVNRVGLTNFVREELILRHATSVPHDTILDIGCASGRQVFALCPHVTRIVGVDIAQTFIDECNIQKENLGHANTEFFVAGFDSLPEGTFDVVICGEVLEHVVDLEGDTDKLCSRVKPGGHVVITVPHFNADGTWWGRLLRRIGMRHFEPLEHFSTEEIVKHGDAHIREFSCKRLVHLFQKRGYTVKKLHTVSHLDGPMGDKIISAFLERAPSTRRFFIWQEHLLQKLFPKLGRHIVLLAQKSAL